MLRHVKSEDSFNIWKNDGILGIPMEFLVPLSLQWTFLSWRRPRLARTAECFDPASGTWMSLPPMQERCPSREMAVAGCVAVSAKSVIASEICSSICFHYVFLLFFLKVHHFHSEHIDHVDLKFIICSSLCIRFFFIFFPVPVPSHHPIFSIRSIIPSPRAQGAPAQ